MYTAYGKCKNKKKIDQAMVEQALQKKALQYDKKGEEHWR